MICIFASTLWKRFICTLSMIILVLLYAQASVEPDIKQIKKDLLLRVVSDKVSSDEKMKLYIDLYDIENDYQRGKKYLNQSLKYAIANKNVEYIFEILDIHCKYNYNNNKELEQYLGIAEKNITGNYKYYFITWLKAYSSVNKLDKADKAEEGTKEIESYNQSRGIASDKYTELQREMVIASSMECVGYFMPGVERYSERIFHLENVRKAVRLLPSYIGYKYYWYYLTRIEFIYRSMGKDKIALECLNNLEKLYKQQFGMDFYKRRKYMVNRNLESLLDGVYSEMLYFGKYLGKAEIERIFSIYTASCKRKGLLDTYEYKTTALLYYGNTDRYNDALRLINQLIAHADTTDTNKMTTLMAKKISIINQMKDNYKEGFEAFWRYNHFMSKSKSEDTNNQLVEMQTLYNMDKLKFEKAEIQAHYHKIALLVAGSLVFVFFIVIIVQYILVNRLKHAKRELVTANDRVVKESERAKAGENAKSEFIKSICHEIRTPLNAICGFSRLLLSSDSTDEEKSEFPVIIEENTNNLTSLLDDILLVADLGSSSDKLEYKECDIESMFASIIDSYRKEADGQIEYIYDTDNVTSPIQTNQRFLKRVVDNLLHNSTKFTRKGFIKLSKRVSDNNLYFSVTDSGVGIPPDKAEFVFGRFTKIDSFTQGVGLGLYICRTIVERMNGTINIDTDYRGGVKIDVTIPLVVE